MGFDGIVGISNCRTDPFKVLLKSITSLGVSGRNSTALDHIVDSVVSQFAQYCLALLVIPGESEECNTITMCI